MKNKNIVKVLIACLSCLLLVGVAFGVVAFADESEPAGATSAQIVYKNVAHKGAPGLVYYVKTDAPLAANQKLKMIFWKGENVDGIYSEHNATYVKYATEEVSIDGVSYYAVVAEGVAPSEIRSTLITRPVIVNCDDTGNETDTVYSGSVFKYSVFDYVIEMLSKEGGAAEDQEKLYTALLDYAAAVQEILFTNQYNGKINEDKLAAAGGWADAYYVIQLNKYVYNNATGLYAPNGDYVRYFARSLDEKVTLAEDLHYTVGETTYAFRGYRNMDDSYILDNNSLITTVNSVSIASKSLSSDVCDVYPKNIGLTQFKVLYGVNNVEYITYDDKVSIEDSKSHSEFWAQYNVSSTNTKDNLTTVEITEYYYNKEKITYFYTSDGSISQDINDYHYAAISTTTADDGTVTETLVTGKITEANRSKYTYLDINDVSVEKKKLEVMKQGHVDWVADPLAADGETTEHGNVMVVAKYIYDTNKTTNPNKDIYEDIVNVNNIKGDGNSQDFKTVGNVYLWNCVTPSSDGSSGSNKIGGINVDIASVSPDVIYKDDQFPVHTFETDILVDALTSSIVTQVYLFNGSTTMLQLNIVNQARGSDEFYLNVNSGPGKSTGRYDANGNAISTNILAGSNGTVQVGDKLYHNTWYNLRLEYIAADDQAIILLYINDELVSYVVDSAITESDNQLTAVRFFNLNASRKTFIYLDNTKVSTDGSTVEEIKEEFSDFTEIYYQNGITHGGGIYFDKSAQVDKSYKPANSLSSNKVIVEETLPDGSTNYALKIFKVNSSTGYSATVPVDLAGGNYYIFETDIKVIGSDNTTDWMFKFSFQNSNIGSPSDTQEIIMPTIGYKEPGYWTFITNYSNHQAKLKLDEWHNIRFEYNPATGELKTYVNNVAINLGTLGVTKTSGVANSTANFAGVSLNIRGKNATYTEILFDNMYATTDYSSCFGVGENYASSEKYDDFVATDTSTPVEETDGSTVTNVYVDTSDIVIEGAPSNPLGHDYIFETDIRWNGITGFESIDDTTANVLNLKLYSDTGEILSIDGIATDLIDSDMLLKVGTTTVATLINDLWMNLKVVYTPGEVEEIDGVVTYSATYSICINGAPLYTATVSGPDMENLKFNRAVLTISSSNEALTPSVSIDNTYVGTRYNDYYKKGDNYSSSDKINVVGTDGKTKDSVLEVVGTSAFFTDLTIGSSYVFETDFKWIEGVGYISLNDQTSDFFKIKIVPDADDSRYADLVYCTTDESGAEVEEYIYRIYVGIWYNLKITAKTVSIVVDETTEETREACMFVVEISGIERFAVEKEIDTPFVKAVFTAVTDKGLVADNVYTEVINSNYSGKGQYKDSSIGSYITAGTDGSINYDQTFAETDPDGEFTDGYVAITKGQITIGKGTAISNLVEFVNSGSGTSKHVFESDFKWSGTENGVMEPIAGTDGLGVFYTVTLKDAEGADLLTIYAVGNLGLDVAQPNIDFVQLYTSLDDVASGNSIASASADVWYNLRVEYAVDGAYTVYVNNKAVASGTGAASDVMSGVDVELGDKVYDTALAIKYTYISTDTVVADN